MKRAYYRSIPCYFKEDSGDIKGRNLFYDLVLEIMIFIDVNVFLVEEFPIWIEEDK